MPPSLFSGDTEGLERSSPRTNYELPERKILFYNEKSLKPLF